MIRTQQDAKRQRRRFEQAQYRAHECACLKAEKTACGVEGECFHFVGYRGPECRNCHNTGIQANED